MPNHTPGPWIFDENDDEILGVHSRNDGGIKYRNICKMFMAYHDEEQSANIRLVLAAPHLLDACNLIHNWITTNSEEPVEIGSKIELQLRTAITKATGNF